MSTLTTVAKPLERIAKDPLWLRQFSVTEYHKMVQTGILTPDDRVELLEGWIVNKMPQKPTPYQLGWKSIVGSAASYRVPGA